MTTPSNGTVSVLLISFVFSPNLGGIETHLDDLVTYITGHGHRVTVITYQPLLSSRWMQMKEKTNNLEIFRIPWLRFNLYRRLQGAPILQMVYLIPPILLFSIFYLLKHKKEIDIIQVHGFNMAVVGGILSWLFSVPFTINTHVSFRFRKGSLYARVLRSVLGHAKRILVLTKDAKEELVRIGIARERISIYHYWVDRCFQPLDKQKSRKMLLWDKNQFIVIFVGRFIPEKGVRLVLEATSRMPSSLAFKFIGSGPLENLVKQRARLQSNVSYEGEKTKKELPIYYSAADICVIPSLPPKSQYTEGIPRVMIESFSCGLPVVATNVGGLKDYVSSKVGFSIKPDTTSLTKCLSGLSRYKLSKMRFDCQILVKDEFSLEKNAQIIEQSLL